MGRRDATIEPTSAVRRRLRRAGPAGRPGRGTGFRRREWQRLSEAGVAQANAGDLAEAELSFRAANELAASLPDGDPRQATSANNLGFVLYAQGRTREALPYYAEALSLRDATLGPTHPVTAQSLNNLAEALRTEGQRDEAEKLHRRAIEIRRTRLSPNHPELAESLSNLGILLTDERRFDEAQALFTEALAIRIAAFGEQHSAVAEVKGNLGALAFARGQYEEALRLQREALAIEEAIHGPGDPAIAFALGNLAQVQMAEGKTAEAVPVLERALAIRIAALGPDRLETAQSRQALALALMQTDPGRARSLLADCLATRERLLGPTSPELVAVLADLAEIERGQGDYDAALPLLQRAVTIQEANYGPDDARLAMNLNNLALLQTDRGAWQEADKLLARTARIEAAGPRSRQPGSRADAREPRRRPGAARPARGGGRGPAPGGRDQARCLRPTRRGWRPHAAALRRPDTRRAVPDCVAGASRSPRSVKTRPWARGPSIDCILPLIFPIQLLPKRSAGTEPARCAGRQSKQRAPRRHGLAQIAGFRVHDRNRNREQLPDHRTTRRQDETCRQHGQVRARPALARGLRAGEGGGHRFPALWPALLSNSSRARPV